MDSRGGMIRLYILGEVNRPMFMNVSISITAHRESHLPVERDRFACSASSVSYDDTFILKQIYRISSFAARSTTSSVNKLTVPSSFPSGHRPQAHPVRSLNFGSSLKVGSDILLIGMA